MDRFRWPELPTASTEGIPKKLGDGDLAARRYYSITAYKIIADLEPITPAEFRLMARLKGNERKLVVALQNLSRFGLVRIGLPRVSCGVTNDWRAPWRLAQ